MDSHAGPLTVKKYHSEKTVVGWRHNSIQLLPTNPAFEPIEIEAEEASDLVIIAEYLDTVPKRSSAPQPANPQSLR